MRHAEVALQLGGRAGAGSLTYRVPDDMPVRPGDVVLVPLMKRLLPGVVVAVAGETPEFPTRPVEDRLAGDQFLGPLQLTLARWISAHYRAPLYDCLALFLPPGLTATLKRGIRAGTPGAPQALVAPGARTPVPPTAGPPLTIAQETAARRICAAIDRQEHRAFLLHGVTGSGKTHVYFEAVARALAVGRQAIVLVSEIALTPTTVSRFEERFPGRVAVLHSKLTPTEHRRAWERVRTGDADVVVGPRSALFAPVRRPGVVILDEEHEAAYKQEATPRYHAREVALWWGQLARAPVVLGSATPDVESYYRAERGRYTLLTLPTRFLRADDAPMPPPAELSGAARKSGADASSSADSPAITLATDSLAIPRADTMPTTAAVRPLPPVEVVDMRAELQRGNSSIFSQSLAAALGETLARGEQALLFLNRRGTATCVSCRDCGHVLACRRCDVPLVYHRADNLLVCHRCNRRRPSPARCPACDSPRIRYFGLGTQRVEAELRAAFPTARTIRWDRDTTTRRGAHDELWRAFGAGDADILIGTQMIAKALDYPRVTLVGVVLADVGLFLPDLRAGERAFQLLSQMAGRSGRGPLGGRAIVQTYAPDHYAVAAAARHDYPSFYRQEMQFRRAHGYPPVGRLVRLVYTGSPTERCQREAATVRELLDRSLARQGIADIRVVGPAPCYLKRVRGRERWQIVLRGDRFARVLDGLALPPGWTIDVDPASLL